MLSDIVQERIKKLRKLKQLGINPYPEVTKRSCTITEALKHFAIWKRQKKNLYLCGRIWAIRGHGKLIFVDIKDQSGKIQLILKADILKDKIQFFQDFFDRGDFIEAKGTLYLTKRGEKSLLVNDFKILAKSLRPLPKEWYGLKDVEERYRKRYLDLLENPEVKERILIRARIINSIREFLIEKGYIEVDTPVLQTKYGGASARPFITRLESLRMKLYLRIAPELYLKRLLIGGLENIFEIGKNFRNEGLDREHNPEFSMLELYSAYKTREDLMKLIKQLFLSVSRKLKREFPKSSLIISLPRKWNTIDYEKFLFAKTGLTLSDSNKKWRKKAQELGVKISPYDNTEKISDNIFKKFRSKIATPTFVINQPTAISPLAKPLSSDPSKTARFLLIINGWEVVNGFSELNDPIEQKKRFQEQARLKRKGDEEAHPRDEEFLEALEYGMPPAAGLGIGLDRLVAVFTSAPSLKEVIIFPFMRPKKK